MGDMPNYYYEYAVPSPEFGELDPDEAREHRTNPELYDVKSFGLVYSQTVHGANEQAKASVADGFPAFGKHSHGLIMLAEAPDTVDSPSEYEFSDSDWRERLERETPDPDDTVLVNVDCPNK
jgi:hypothetical protein